MRDADNIRAADTLPIDYMGFIFYPLSPRFVPPDASAVTAAIKGCTKRKTGVFVNTTLDVILQTADKYELDAIQLHGDEPDTLIGELKQRGFEVIKAIAVKQCGSGELTALKERFPANSSSTPDFLLFDTKCAGYGGSGQRFDWEALNDYHGERPFFLSGGLSPASIPDVASFCHPQLAGIDLNSGFELMPGVKNIEQLRTTLTELYNYAKQN